MEIENEFETSSAVFDCPGVARVVLEELRRQSDFEEDTKVWKWLRTPPRNTVLRVNTSQMTRTEAIQILEGLVGQNQAIAHPTMHEVISIPGKWGWEHFERTFSRHPRAVVVGSGCGVAVLRGAEVLLLAFLQHLLIWWLERRFPFGLMSGAPALGVPSPSVEKAVLWAMA